MNNKIFRALLLTTAVTAGSAVFLTMDKGYQPRPESNIKESETWYEEEGENPEGMIRYFNALRANQVTGDVSEEMYLNAVQASNNLINAQKRAVNTVWSELGPDNVGGRTRAFLQDVDSPNIMYVGGVSGGLFRSTGKGSSWKPVNDYQDNLNVSCIAQNKDRVIVYGTGEGQFVSIDGTERGTPGFQANGMYRSTNSGYTFTRVNLNVGNISSLAAEKGGTRFYAATDNGLRYSDDGLTWTNGRPGTCKEVKVGNNGVVWAQVGVSLLRSTDRGVNWTTMTLPGASVSRLSIAVSPQDPDYVYAMVSNGASRLDGVWRTTDGGTNWTKIIAQGTNYFDPLATTNPQGNYNNVISVDPRNKNRIIMGGQSLAEWTEGTNPRIIASMNDFAGNRQYVHADKHVIEWDMTTNPPTLIVGSDGGLSFSSDNMVTYTQKNFGFNATQFYTVAADYEGNVVGGSQDNGTQYINKKGNTPKSAIEIKGGDGFQNEISVKNNSIIFSETYYGNITRSRDYGKSQACIWDRRIARSFIGLSDTSKYCDHSHKQDWAPFNTMIKLWEHPETDSTQARLFIARYGQVWMCENATDLNKSPEWYLVSTAQGGGDVWDLEVTPDGNSLFIATTGNIFRVDGLNSATYYKWSNPLSIPAGITTTNLGITGAGGRVITSVNLNPNNSNEALITLGNYGNTNYVIKGTNMLGTPAFTNITSNLPAMPVYDGLIAFSSSNLMFLATDLGVYASDNGGSTWTAQTNPANGFPKVATFAIRQYRFPNKSIGAMYAGTHGRGFFECTQYKTNIKSTAAVNKNSLQISAYPNPANDVVTLNYNLQQDDNISCTVMDITGKVVKVYLVGLQMKGTNSVKVETSAMVSGTYFVVVNGTNKSKGTVKLIVSH